MKLPRISGFKLLKFLSKHHGFRVLRQKGSHVTITKDKKFITIPLHNELDVGTLASILSDAGVDRKEFLASFH